jgi:hypothetical protein
MVRDDEAFPTRPSSCGADFAAKELFEPIAAFAREHLASEASPDWPVYTHRAGMPLATGSWPRVEIEVWPGETFGWVDVSSWSAARTAVTTRYCVYVMRNGSDTTVLIKPPTLIDI